MANDQLLTLLNRIKEKKGIIMEFVIGASCFLGGAFVGAVLMAIVAGSRSNDK